MLVRIEALCSILVTLLGALSLVVSMRSYALDELKPLPLLQERSQAPLDEEGIVAKGGNNLTQAAYLKGVKEGDEIAFDMPIHYAEGRIYNPATGKRDKVNLRSYNGEFIAPTVVMRPGQTVRFNIQNQLPVQGEECVTEDSNTPAPYGCFNVTNLHSHGLWISPSGNSDNVLLSINPGVDFEYEYNVPSDHPAGTFWYHPHKHGSTAMQVASGMSGALVIKGNRYPSKTSNGDLDTLLKSFEPKAGAYAEVKLLQQIPYACFDKDGNIKKTYEETPEDGINPWVCEEGDVGVVEDFSTQVGSPSAWGESGRYTSINGQARPEIIMNTAQLYRWRMIDAGFNETVNLRIRKVSNTKNLLSLLKNSKDKALEVQNACDGFDVEQFEVASDGLTHNKIIKKIINVLQPGYRSDILFSLPEEGQYCVYDDASTEGGSVSLSKENAKVLAIIHARGKTVKVSQERFLKKQLIKAAKKQPSSVRKQIVADLNALKLTKFVPHASITAKEINRSGLPPEIVVFNLIPGSGDISTQFLVNGEEYSGSRIDHTLILGKAQEWKLSSLNVSHPFHIHVNPFQIVKIENNTGEPMDPQFIGLVGTWRDTLMVIPGYEITVRTRYQRYIGEYVLHCHILEHEDQGMMQNVQVVLPDGKGGAQTKSHH